MISPQQQEIRDAVDSLRVTLADVVAYGNYAVDDTHRALEVLWNRAAGLTTHDVLEHRALFPSTLPTREEVQVGG